MDQSGEWFKEGMKLEAIDPLNLSTICVATIRKVREWVLKYRNVAIRTVCGDPNRILFDIKCVCVYLHWGDKTVTYLK